MVSEQRHMHYKMLLIILRQIKGHFTTDILISYWSQVSIRQTGDHTTLLNKLELYGIRGVGSYIPDGSQFILLNNILSNEYTIWCSTRFGPSV